MGKRRESLGELYELCDNSNHSGSSYAEFIVFSKQGCKKGFSICPGLHTYRPCSIVMQSGTYIKTNLGYQTNFNNSSERSTMSLLSAFVFGQIFHAVYEHLLSN